MRSGRPTKPMRCRTSISRAVAPAWRFVAAARRSSGGMSIQGRSHSEQHSPMAASSPRRCRLQFWRILPSISQWRFGKFLPTGSLSVLSSLRNDRAPVDRDVDHRDEVSPARRVIAPLLVFGSAADVLNCLAAVFCSSRLTEIASWNTTVVLFHDEYTVSVLPDNPTFDVVT